MERTARIIEVFPSLQGEGVYVGQPHLFVRFWNCNMACRYCDTDYKGPYQEYTQAQLLAEVEGLLHSAGPFHAVSLTGGEPLLWAPFLEQWLPQLKALGQRTYLETNGTLHEALKRLLGWIDIVAMDIKPPSATGDRAVWRDNEAFLKTADEAGKDLFVKLIVTAGTADEEVRRSVELVRSAAPEVPLVLQPATPFGEMKEAPAPEQLTRWRAYASERLSDVRVVPQMHKVWGVR